MKKKPKLRKERAKSKWEKDGDTLVHRPKSESGYSNIKIYGRYHPNPTNHPDHSTTNTKHTKNLIKPLDDSKEPLLLYLCGHPEGYDYTENGFMLRPYKFNKLAVYITKQYGFKIFEPIRLRQRDILKIIVFLNSVKEEDLLGEPLPPDKIQRTDLIKNWTTELKNILIEKELNKEIEIFLELYENIE